MPPVIPTALSRRLILALLGFTYVDGRWWRGREALTEEQVDCMTAQTWRRAVRRWRRSVLAMHEPAGAAHPPQRSRPLRVGRGGVRGAPA
jgi:hypothetical protein